MPTLARIEEASHLLEHDEQYRLMAEVIPHIVFLADPDGNVIYYNQRYHEYAASTAEEFEKEVLHPDDYDRCEAQWAQSITTGEPYEIEYRLRRAADGKYRWHLGRAVPIRDASGRIVKWLGTCTDIHDQKMAEEEVRRLNQELEQRVRTRTSELQAANIELESEIAARERVEEQEHANLERLKNMIGIMPMGALVTDEEGIVLHANERFCDLFELRRKPESLIGKHLEEIVHMVKQVAGEPEFYIHRLKLTFQSHKIVLNQEIPLKNGRMLVRDYLPIMVHDKPQGHVLLYRDITYERRVDAAKSEFMSLASHQLRTPLTAVRWALGRLSRMLHDRLSPTESKLFASAQGAVVHMANSIDTMLAISRIEAGKVSLKQTDVTLVTLLRAIVEQQRDLISKKHLQLSIDVPPQLTVYTDENLLEEVIVNLFSNAVKYTPDGGAIVFRAVRGDDAVAIDIEDTGFGIPMHQQKKIFTKFFRGENIIAMNTDGTGLGLYLSYRLVELMGGKLSFVSEENRGTIFTVALPQHAMQRTKPVLQ